MNNIKAVLKRMDERYLWLELKITHAGENLKSTITPEALAAAEASCSNIPIVGFWDEHMSDFGGHEYSLSVKNGELVEQFAGRIIGAIPETNNYRIETDEHGVDWVVVTAFIWTKYAETALPLILAQKQISMEIDIIDFIQTPDAFTITSFIYNAICVLGDDRQPAVDGASLKIVNKELYELKGEEMRKVNEELVAEIDVPADEPIVEVDPIVEAPADTPVVEVDPVVVETDTPVVEVPVVENPVIDNTHYEAEIEALKQIVLQHYAAEFIDVATLEEIQAMKGSVAEIELQLYALRGKKATGAESMTDYAFAGIKPTKVDDNDAPSWVSLMKK